MKRKRHTPELIIRKLREADTMLSDGVSIAQICQKLEVSEQTFHRWRNQYGGMKANDMKHLKELRSAGGKLLSPVQRRQAVGRVRRHMPNVSERRACEVVGQPRATQRYEPKERDEEKTLVKEMLELVKQHPRYGYRRVTALLRGQGWQLNAKRVYRLWRREGMKVPRKQRKRRRLGSSENGIVRRRAAHINQVWCYDFVKDQTTDGRSLKFLPIVDEFTRESLSLEVERSITAEDVIEVLKYLFEVRGAPQFIRSDSGPEFIAHAIRNWLKESGVETLYIEPGSPWENAYCESFNSRLRDELLDRELFTSLREAKFVADEYRLEYNHRRPHSSLKYMTPAAFAASCSEPWSSRPGGLRPQASHRTGLVGHTSGSSSRSLVNRTRAVARSRPLVTRSVRSIWWPARPAARETRRCCTPGSSLASCSAARHRIA